MSAYQVSEKERAGKISKLFLRFGPCKPSAGKCHFDSEYSGMYAGHVTWVGRSSAESTVNLEQKVEGRWEQVTTARFVLVARDPLNRYSNTPGVFLTYLLFVINSVPDPVSFWASQIRIIKKQSY